MKYIDFNINETVLVKLTDLGYQRLAYLHNYVFDKTPNWDKRDATYYEKRADANGYTSFQMWEFMKKFGSVTGLCKPQYYHLDVKLKVK